MLTTEDGKDAFQGSTRQPYTWPFTQDEIGRIGGFMCNSQDPFERHIGQAIDVGNAEQRRMLAFALQGMFTTYGIAVVAHEEYEASYNKTKTEYLNKLQAAGLKQRFPISMWS